MTDRGASIKFGLAALAVFVLMAWVFGWFPPMWEWLKTRNWGLLDQQIINGVQLGSIYALIALGYTMVYGVLRLINFAHGEVYMVGAFIAYYIAEVWFEKNSINIWLLLTMMIFGSMIVCAALGVTIERIAYRPLRNAPRISILITAIGVSLFLQQSLLLVFRVSPPPSITEQVNPFDRIKVDWPLFGELTFAGGQLAMFGMSIVLMIVLWWFVTRTKTGRAMRAVSHDFSTAALMGIDVNKVVTITFIIGSALAGAAAMMNATALGTPLKTDYGLLPGVKAFVAAVLGGIGNIPGAVLGGFLMGVAELMVVWAGYDMYRDAVAFVILIFVLLFKPTGLLGSTAVEKA
ncbi:MAG: branched-chain amino acid ABC transporter permease [Fimbriimonadales bacterium]|nr:branched-chain amino acid ABC transporter permease [Fimbriimonadales bacterium]